VENVVKGMNSMIQSIKENKERLYYEKH